MISLTKLQQLIFFVWTVTAQHCLHQVSKSKNQPIRYPIPDLCWSRKLEREGREQCDFISSEGSAE